MKRKLSLFKLGGIVAAALLSASAWAATINYPGFVKVERFDNSGSLPALIANAKFIANTPDDIKFISVGGSYDHVEPNSLDNFGARLTGYITPTEEADYVFFMSADDNAAFYLSTDATPANLKLIAADIGWQSARTWTGPGGDTPKRRGDFAGNGPFENRSDQFLTSPRVKGPVITATSTNGPAAGAGLPRGVPSATGADKPWPNVDTNGNAVIHLLAGQKYYFQVLYNDGSGDAIVDWAWKKVGDDDPANSTPGTEMAPDFLSVDYTDTLAFKTTPTNTAVLEGQPVTFKSEAIGFPGGVTYQWYVDGVSIDDGTGVAANYVIPSTTVAGNNGKKYKVVITSNFTGATVTSPEATLTVSVDNIPPTVVKIRTSEDRQTVRVYYSEPVSDEALTIGNYVFNPTLTVTDAIWDTDLHQEAGILPVAGADPHVATDLRMRTSVILFVTGMTTNATYSLAISNVKDLAGNALTPNTKSVTSPVFMTGIVNYKRWMRDASIVNLKFDTARLANPSEQGTLTLTETPSYSDNNNDYVDRLSGYFIPPTNGDYVFFTSVDNDGFLYLSTDSDPANMTIVAADIGWQNARTWTGPGGQDVNQTPQWRRGDRTTGTGPFENRTDQFLTSPRAGGAGLPSGAPFGWANTDANGNQVITLVAGQRYYFEMYHSEFDGGHEEFTYKLSTEADPANGTASRVTGNLIGTFVDPSSLLPVISAQPTNVNYTIGGSITFNVTATSSLPLTYQWYFNGAALANQTNATLTVNNTTADSLGSYYVAVSNENGTVNSTGALALTAVTAPGLTYQEDTNGTTVFEAEHYFAATTAPDGHLWVPLHSRAGFSGNGYMQILPDAGVNLGNGLAFTNNGCHLDFKIVFQKTGTHYIWIRGADPVSDGAGDSVHAGLDGVIPTSAIRIDGTPTFDVGATGWNWVGNIQGDTRAMIDVPTTGTHTFTLYMREDGFQADKVILTTDSTFAPTATGPAESALAVTGPNISIARNGSSVVITYTGTLVSSSTINGSFTAVAGASGGSYTIPAGTGTTFFKALQ